MLVNGIRIEEEFSASTGTVQEIASSGSDPVEDRVTGSGLQNEQGNDLLNEETDDNGWPAQAIQSFLRKIGIANLPGYMLLVHRRNIQARLEDEETENRYSTVAIASSLWGMGQGGVHIFI